MTFNVGDRVEAIHSGLGELRIGLGVGYPFFYIPMMIGLILILFAIMIYAIHQFFCRDSRKERRFSGPIEEELVAMADFGISTTNPYNHTSNNTTNDDTDEEEQLLLQQVGEMNTALTTMGKVVDEVHGENQYQPPTYEDEVALPEYDVDLKAPQYVADVRELGARRMTNDGQFTNKEVGVLKLSQLQGHNQYHQPSRLISSPSMLNACTPQYDPSWSPTPVWNPDLAEYGDDDVDFNQFNHNNGDNNHLEPNRPNI